MSRENKQFYIVLIGLLAVLNILAQVAFPTVPPWLLTLTIYFSFYFFFFLRQMFIDKNKRIYEDNWKNFHVVTGTGILVYYTIKGILLHI